MTTADKSTETTGALDSPQNYDRPSLAADIVAFTVQRKPQINYRRLPQMHLAILLVQRAEPPYVGSWSLPGGFVVKDEPPEQAARRALKNKTGLEDCYLALLDIAGEQGRDPRGWIVSAAYWTLLEEERLLKHGAGTTDACWFDVTYRCENRMLQRSESGTVSREQWNLSLTNGKETLSARIEVTRTSSLYNEVTECRLLENNDLAFDHAIMIAKAVFQLRHSVADSNIAFKLVPELFTLTELQQVYETILDKELLAANFRRKIAALVSETEDSTKSAGHRPSKLYRRSFAPQIDGRIAVEKEPEK